jgi:hypothetical protein
MEKPGPELEPTESAKSQGPSGNGNGTSTANGTSAANGASHTSVQPAAKARSSNGTGNGRPTFIDAKASCCCQLLIEPNAWNPS